MTDTHYEKTKENEGECNGAIQVDASEETITIVVALSSNDCEVDPNDHAAAANDAQVETTAAAPAFSSVTPRWVDSNGINAWPTEGAVDAALKEFVESETKSSGITWNQVDENRHVGSCGVSSCGWRIEKALDSKSSMWYVRVGNIPHSHHHEETVLQSSGNDVTTNQNETLLHEEASAGSRKAQSSMHPQPSAAAESQSVGQVSVSSGLPSLTPQVSQPGAYRVYPSGSAQIEHIDVDYDNDDNDDDSPLRRVSSSAVRNMHEEYLVEADVVETEPEKPLVEGKPVQRKLQFLVLLAVLLFGALVVGLPLGLTSASRSSTTATSNQTLGTPVSELIDTFRTMLPNETLAALNTASSPQYKAFQWLSSNQHPPIRGDDPMLRMLQRFTLATLYYATGGGDHTWTNSLGWLDDNQHECTWFGCGCTTKAAQGGGGGGSVQSIRLRQNNLIGTLPQELSLLSLSLLEMDLADNVLRGTIPPEFENLIHLQSLLLGGNWLSGFLSTELGKLSRLTDLALDFNNFTDGSTIPTELGYLQELQNLNLSRNALVGTIPSELTKLSKLINLDLGDNNLSGIISTELGRLVDLRVLRLGGDWMYSYVRGPIPSEFANLSNLIELHLAKLSLTGTIPTELGSLSNLEKLRLDETGVTGTIPTELGKLSKLNELDLHKEDQVNKLGGSLPAEFGGLTSLSTLALDGNDLTGSIPTLFGQLTNLTQLHLSANRLTGTIPLELGELVNLESLFLMENELTGSVPTEFGKLSRLTDLSLYANGDGLGGTIPTELGDMSNLLYMYLWGNALTGTIPTQLGKLSQLTEVFLALNQLDGTIPSEFGLLSELTELILSDNNLTGTIPKEIAAMTSLERFKVWNNMLSGSVPDAVCNLIDTNFVKVCTDVECDCDCIPSDRADECSSVF